jgi:type III pantothenate kinase
MDLLSNSLYLSDIGNTNIKFWRNERIEIFPVDFFFKTSSPKTDKFKQNQVFYISVNHRYSQELEKLTKWKNIENYFQIKTDYLNLGIDRVSLMFSQKNAILVDLGTAITVDIVKNSKHLGGYILLGKNSTLETFKKKTPHLNLNQPNNFQNSLPQKTEEAIYFGFFHQLETFLEGLQKKYQLPIIITGGDAEEFFEISNLNLELKKDIIFQNILKINNLF